MAELSARQQQLLSLIVGRPHGMTRAAISKAAGIKPSYASEVLRVLRKLGLAAPTSTSSAAVWATPDRATELQLAMRARAKVKIRVRRKRRQAVEDSAALEAWLQVTHRVVPAACAPRIKTTAPSSVFHLASA